MLNDSVKELQEEWRPCGLLPGYEVSSKGLVRNIETAKLKTIGMNRGYPCVYSRSGGSTRLLYTHRLVALAFLGDPPTAKHEVAHWDGDKTNTNVSNLRWATRSENQLDAVRHGTQSGLKARAEAHRMAKLSWEKVAEIRERSRNGETMPAIAADFEISLSAASRVARGRNWIISQETISSIADIEQTALALAVSLASAGHTEASARARRIIEHAKHLKRLEPVPKRRFAKENPGTLRREICKRVIRRENRDGQITEFLVCGHAVHVYPLTLRHLRPITVHRRCLACERLRDSAEVSSVE